MAQYDVIVAGAGPSGTFAAYNLANRGLKVLIIDKARFPRYKVCGGGIPVKARELLPFDLSSICQSEVNSFMFSSNYDVEYKRTFDKPLIQCFMRDDFDNFLLQKALSSGATLIESEKIKEIYRTNNTVSARTTASTFTARFLIGADGCNSITAKSLKLMQKKVSMAYAIESEIKVSDSTMEKYHKTVGLDWGTLTNGYGWIFPKKDQLSVGVGGPLVLSKSIKGYYENLIKNLGLEIKENISMQGHFIPFRKGNNRIYSSSAVLVGDAAGLTDPLTGEGIYYALKSGLIAAETIIDIFDRRHNDMSIYQQRVDNEIMPELNAALPIQYIFNTAPMYFHKMLRDNDRLWSAFCRILRGELSYTAVKAKLPASAILWQPLVQTTKLINKFKVKE